MLINEDTLPGPKSKRSFNNWNGLGCSCQNHANVAWHIVGPLSAVCVVASTFRNQTRKKALQISANRRISVLENDQAGTGMLNKDGRDPVSNPTFVNRGRNTIGNFIESSARSFDDEFFIINIDHRTLSRSGATSGLETAQVPSGS